MRENDDRRRDRKRRTKREMQYTKTSPVVRGMRSGKGATQKREGQEDRKLAVGLKERRTRLSYFNILSAFRDFINLANLTEQKLIEAFITVLR